jgi:hypothetical protein
MTTHATSTRRGTLVPRRDALSPALSSTRSSFSLNVCASTRTHEKRFPVPALVASLLLVLAACGDRAHESRTTPVAPRSAAVFEPVDLAFTSPAPLTATFRGPGGNTVTSVSFPRGAQQVVRLTATEPGLWTYSVSNGIHPIGSGRIRAAAARTRGFVRPHGHALEYANGTPFVAIGENRINIYDRQWNWLALSIDDYLAYMAAHDMTVLRVFIVSDVENEETHTVNAGVIEPTLGHFDEQVAQTFDRIFRAAQARGIYVVLVAFALGFSENDDWKSWQDNPYSKERGGPASTRFEFFDSPAVRARAAERIRYLAARYGPFPNLLAIDLLNEPEWDGGIPEVTWAPWAEAMAREWRRADPYRHAVTVGSVGLHWNIEGDEREWWRNSACDIVQWHLYGPEVYEVHALAAEITRKVRETWSYDKPVLLGEFAYGGEPKPDYDHTHVGLWSAAFSGGGVLAHSAPAFNIDSDELMTPERARHYRVLKKVLAPLVEPTPGTAHATSGTAWTLLTANAGALWLLAPKNKYGSTIAHTRIVIPAISDGSWQVEWLDDVSGARSAAADVETRSGKLELAVPPYSRHIVARLTRR